MFIDESGPNHKGIASGEKRRSALVDGSCTVENKGDEQIVDDGKMWCQLSPKKRMNGYGDGLYGNGKRA